MGKNKAASISDNFFKPKIKVSPNVWPEFLRNSSNHTKSQTKAL